VFGPSVPLIDHVFAYVDVKLKILDHGWICNILTFCFQPSHFCTRMDGTS
jgi:hypothetical protein